MASNPNNKKKPATKKPATKKPAKKESGTKKPPGHQRDRKADAPPGSASEECVVVGIGASAGGLQAYKSLLKQLPVDSGLAYVLVQHLDPSHESLMVELLSKYTSMPVLQIENATPVQPDHVYMIPPNRFITIRDNALFLDEPIAHRGIRLPIDHFFRSLATARKKRAICIVLSGTGSDGAAGLREIKAEGGMTIVQQPESAEYDGMPRAAIETGAVDLVLPLAEMAEVIVPYARHPYVQARRESTLADASPDHFRAILSLLHAHTDHDFNRYKKGTLIRRIERRMGIRHISRPGDYLKLLREDGEEVDSLFKDVLIGVTRFFRDPQVWDTLNDALTPTVLAKRNEEPFRVWVPGCASGEEAYSIAMLLFEQQQRQGRRIDVQVFGTDIDVDAIDIARSGVYRENVAKDIPESYIDTYFQREGDSLRVRKKIRESCVFAAQNLLSDPPFSGLDLVSCRNLLIYLEPDAQRRVFDLVHFALKPGGLLFLGTSESPSQRKHLFSVVSQPCRIYRKVGDSKPGVTGLSYAAGRLGRESKPGIQGKQTADLATAAKGGAAEVSRRALLERYAPASVVVNQRGLIQYIHGSVRDYLDFPSGEPDLDVCQMAFEGLRAKLRMALNRARTDDGSVSVVAPRVRRNGSLVAVGVHIHPLPGAKSAETLYLVSFLDEPSSIPVETAKASPAPEDEARRSDKQLALELQAVREDLQNTIEEFESANEELKASNEEAVSMNEELQSTNEELETSREELQSLNEELSTVNNQLHDKVEELEATNNDLTNLLASTDMATLFLDRDLRIRRFTPATTRLMSLIDADVGRPVSDLAPRVNDADLVDDARTVLSDLSSIEKEVHNGGGHSYMRRITPFRTSKNRIEGVVITFSDVTSLRDATARAELRERQQAVVARLGREALGVDNLQELLDETARSVAETLGVDYCKLLRLEPDRKHLRLVAGVGWRDDIGDVLLPTGLDSQGGYTLQSANPVIVEDLRREKRFSRPALLLEHNVVSGMSVVIGPTDAPWGVLGVHSRTKMEFTIDDTNFVQAVCNLLWEAIAREDYEARFRALVDSSAQIVWTTNADGQVEEDSPSWREFTGQTYDERKGYGWLNAIHPDDRAQVESEWREAVAAREGLNIEYRLRHVDAGWRWMDVHAVPLEEFDGTVRGWVGMNTDVTAYKTAVDNQMQLAAIVESSDDSIISKTLDGIVTSWNKAAEALYGYTAAEMIGAPITRIVPEGREEEIREILEKLRRGEGLHNLQTIRIAKDGAEREVALTISPIFDASGKPAGGSIIARDIAAQRRLEAKLEESSRAAQAASDAKSQFLANMSHEIRTPLTAILGYAEVLNTNLDDPDARACARTIRDNGNHLLEILNDILDLSKIESGKLAARRRATSIIEVLSEIRSLMAVRATEHSLALSIGIDGPIPSRISTDPQFLRQILVNLVGNAIKYTPKGSVHVSVACDADNEKMVISVTDTGIGIDANDIGRLFEPFEQLDRSLSRSAGGSGLGLSITKQLVERLGGELTVDSEIDKGSTFRFTLETGPLDGVEWTDSDTDLAEVKRSKSEPANLPSVGGRVLVVDDRREVRFLLRRFLESAGAEVTVADSGHAALELVHSNGEAPAFEAIVLDLQMPYMDGLETARRLRARGYGGPLVALTAHAMPANQEQCFEAGFDDFISKPIDQAHLLRTLSVWLKSAARSAGEPQDEISVLCVEDNADTCEVYREYLEQAGYRVETARTGEEALRRLVDFIPDIVLVDNQLPDTTGIELMEQFKLKPALGRARFICISGREADDIDWETAGFEHYVRKPVSLQALDARLRRLGRALPED